MATNQWHDVFDGDERNRAAALAAADCQVHDRGVDSEQRPRSGVSFAPDTLCAHGLRRGHGNRRERGVVTCGPAVARVRISSMVVESVCMSPRSG